MTYDSLFSLSLYSSIPSWTVFCWYDHLQKGNNKNAPEKKSSTTLINQEILKKYEKGVIILPTQTMHYYFLKITMQICCP